MAYLLVRFPGEYGNHWSQGEELILETNIDHHKAGIKIGALQMQHPGEANMEYLRVVKIQGIQHLEMIHVSLTLFPTQSSTVNLVAQDI